MRRGYFLVSEQHQGPTFLKLGDQCAPTPPILKNARLYRVQRPLSPDELVELTVERR